MAKCRITMKREGDFYSISQTGKSCARKFSPVKVMNLDRALDIANARRRLINKAKRRK